MNRILRMTAFLACSALIGANAFAVSGAYVCTDTCETQEGTNSCVGDAEPSDIMKALNSLSCDTTKPFTVGAAAAGSVLTVVCCVQK